VDLLDALEAGARDGARLRGRARHSALVAALVDAGMLAQGIADAAFDLRGEDAPDRASDLAMLLCRALARRVITSWDGLGADGREGAGGDGGADAGASEIVAAVRALRAEPLRDELVLKVPEGYSHYAVYPECYLAAARSLTPGAWTVVGIRSIGTSLAAIVGAALGAQDALTVRPVGHPYDRKLALAHGLRARLASGGARSYAVVDEGPGRSGSSFLAVADELERAGVPRSSIHLLPSHGGDPGSACGGAGALQRWSGLRRHVRTFDDVALAGGAPPGGALSRWFGDALPEAGAASVRDLSAGEWRARACADRGAWPPTFAQQERRKLSLSTSEGEWLAEFAGVGRFGEVRFERARRLAQAGFGPPVAALRHGFIIRPWIAARPLTPGDLTRGPMRADLVDAVARYLAFRATAMPARAGDGAPPEKLAEMIVANAVECFGTEASPAAGRVAALSSDVSPDLCPVAVDGKLEVWEWLLTAEGRLVKVDGFHHADAHDLAGAQDIAWDVAAARVELGLDPDETMRIVRRVEAASRARLSRRSLAFHEAAYAALRVARWSFALECEPDADERARVEVALERYRNALRRVLSGTTPG
jgi:hypothetical protein